MGFRLRWWRGRLIGGIDCEGPEPVVVSSRWMVEQDFARLAELVTLHVELVK